MKSGFFHPFAGDRRRHGHCGKIIVDGTDISTLTGDALTDYRAATVGFVFQIYNLIPTLTVQKNSPGMIIEQFSWKNP